MLRSEATEKLGHPIPDLAPGLVLPAGWELREDRDYVLIYEGDRLLGRFSKIGFSRNPQASIDATVSYERARRDLLDH